MSSTNSVFQFIFWRSLLCSKSDKFEAYNENIAIVVMGFLVINENIFCIYNLKRLYLFNSTKNNVKVI